MTEVTPTGDTLISQVTPLLGITPRENTQLQSTNTPKDIEDILGTRAFQRYVDTPLQTLDGIVMNQPKCFLPLAKEAKRIAEEIRIEKINEQWAGIPREQLLNQSFNDQLNSIQILEQLAPLQLAKEHLPGDIVDILERLGKVDNIPFNQLYYIVENCANRYYSKVIKTFVALLKCQFADRQLLVNTARSLKFLEEYVDRQALIWKIFQKHKNIPDDIQDLHFHIDDFKTNIEKEFSLLKEATCKNVENFQLSLNLQQTYSVALCSHINNIYNKLAEIQQQLPHSTQHMNTSDVIQIEVPDFDPDIDEALPSQDHQEAQGSANIIQQSPEKTATTRTPASSQQDAQDVDWPDVIPVEILPQPDQDIEQNIPTVSTRHEADQIEISQLETDLEEEEQFQDLQTYLTHHNTYEESQNIHKEYRKRLLELNDDRYYQEVDCAYQTYGSLPARDYIPTNQAPGPCRTTQELMQIFGKGRGQACREELHGH